MLECAYSMKWFNKFLLAQKQSLCVREWESESVKYLASRQVTLRHITVISTNLLLWWFCCCRCCWIIEIIKYGSEHLPFSFCKDIEWTNVAISITQWFLLWFKSLLMKFSLLQFWWYQSGILLKRILFCWSSQRGTFELEMCFIFQIKILKWKMTENPTKNDWMYSGRNQNTLNVYV